MTTVGRVAFVALVPFFLLWALAAAELQSTPTAAHPVARTAAPVSVSSDSAAVPSWPEVDTDQPLAAQSETDLYGNQVDDAVAEYSLDAAGSLYELHAPQVELPHLGSPKS